MRRFFEKRTDLSPRYIEGVPWELEELFGAPLPQLPESHVSAEHGETILVALHPSVRAALRDLVESAYRTLTAKKGRDTGGEVSFWSSAGAGNASARFEEVFGALLISILERERRLGLFNLFWLAHSKDAADAIHEFFSQPGIKIDIKYQMYPVLQGSYRNARNAVWARFKSQGKNRLRYSLGSRFNPRLMDCIIDDQLPLTEVSLARLNPAQVLVDQNRRFRLTFRSFKEIYGASRERLRDGLQRKEARLLDLLRRTLPSVRPELYDDEKSASKILFNSRVVNFLLGDVGEFGSKLLGNPVLRAEVGPGRSWGELITDYLDFLQAVKRSEVVDVLRHSIVIAGSSHSERERRELFEEGRLYRFHPDSEILSSTRKVTVIFADLRGFTRTSERGISERELTQHLYEVFDPLASIVERYHGKIDKFTGDGVMITFGTTQLSRQDELNALRTALTLQEMMRALRAARRTRFEMGISVHTGRAQVAHFIVDDQTMDHTVIGRNVNIAGRLSGSGKTQSSTFDEDSWTHASAVPTAVPQGSGRDVWVDADGTLYNTGIVVSQDTVEEVLKAARCEPFSRESGGGYGFFDDVLKRNVLLEYVGDAKFKGVERSIGIYRLNVKGGGTNPPTSEPRSP
jgi:class 3 adenylate cyclase